MPFSQWQEAISHALLMLGIQRQDCPGGAMPKLPFDASMFEHGGNHSCSAKLQHKFDTNCKGETFKINLCLPGSDTAPSRSSASSVRLTTALRPRLAVAHSQTDAL